jgi:hypothetical protein
MKGSTGRAKNGETEDTGEPETPLGGPDCRVSKGALGANFTDIGSISGLLFQRPPMLLMILFLDQ